ncbi:hypothetical protein HYU96_04775 [Candidatus Daviesbacteria bacterium]|nr:hypothetical protein [Candidatus Daviesbacteria bacterium]
MVRSEQGLDSEGQSALSGVRIDRMPIAHADARRTAVEIFSSPGITIRDSKVLMVNQPPEGKEAVIGGHWEQGIEIIYVQAGEIDTLRLADVNTGEEISHQHLSEGTRVTLPPQIAHQLRFRGPATLIVFNEVPFTPEKLVIYPPWAQEVIS